MAAAVLRLPIANLARLPLRDAVAAHEGDEGRGGELGVIDEAVALLVERSDELVPARADGVHQPPPGSELLHEWLGDALRRSRNDDRQVGGALGHTKGAVADDDGDVAKPDRLQVGPRLLGKV